jgi:actin beta/gamma 1
MFPTLVGFGADRQAYIGEKALLRGKGTAKSPIDCGIINSWCDMETLWVHMFRELGVVPDEQPVCGFIFAFFSALLVVVVAVVSPS